MGVFKRKRSYKSTSAKAYKFARSVMRTAGTRFKYRKGGSKLSRAITRVLDKRTETKQITNTVDQYFNSGISSTGEFYSLIPQITQGVGDAQRIGQKIRMKYLKVKGVVSYELSLNATNNLPIFVDMFILQDRIQRSQNNPPHTYQILNNSGVLTTYNGDSLVAQYPLNTEEWKLVKRKRVRLALNWAPGNSSTGITEPSAKLQRTFSFKIPVYNSMLDYESAGSNLPQNTNFWFTCGFFQYTNTVQTLGTPVRVQYVTTLYYKDD